MGNDEPTEGDAQKKLRLLQYAQSMRHLQTLEGAEIGFVVAAFGALAGKLLFAESDTFCFCEFLFLALAVSLSAGLLVYHFLGRRRTYYWLRRKQHMVLRDLNWPEHIKCGEELFGIVMRVGLIAILSLSSVAAAWRVTEPGREALGLAVAIALWFLCIVGGLGLREFWGWLGRAFDWALRWAREQKVDPDTEVELRHLGGDTLYLRFRELRGQVMLGDTIKIGRQPLGRARPNTKIRRNAEAGDETYRQLRQKARNGDTIIVDP